MDADEIEELGEDEDVWAAALAAAQARAEVEREPFVEPEASPANDDDDEEPFLEPDALIESVSQVVADPAIARLAERLRAGRCVLCAGPRLMARPTLRERIARCIELLDDAEAPLAWEALQS